MNIRHFGLALLLGTIGVSSALFSENNGYTTRHRIKRSRPTPTKTKSNSGLKDIEKQAMEVENAQENQEVKNFEHMLHVFESYVQRLSGEPFEAQDLKALHEAFHALTPAQKERFLKEFSKERVETHIIEQLKGLYQHLGEKHHS